MRRPFLAWTRQPVHKSRCDHCEQRIVWSRKRRQWLALAPVSAETPLARRMRCYGTGKGLHDPRANLYERARARLLPPAAITPTTVQEGH